jgi:hypothetical protein
MFLMFLKVRSSHKPLQVGPLPLCDEGFSLISVNLAASILKHRVGKNGMLSARYWMGPDFLAYQNRISGNLKRVSSFQSSSGYAMVNARL